MHKDVQRSLFHRCLAVAYGLLARQIGDSVGVSPDDSAVVCGSIAGLLRHLGVSDGAVEWLPLFPGVTVWILRPWRIPKIYAEWSAWYIRTWARAPYSDHLGNGYSWIPIWVRNEWRVEKVTGGLPMILAACLRISL